MPIEIANVQLSNSFDNWRNTTNDIIKSLKEQVVLREQLDLTSLSPFPELVGAASLDSVEVSAQPSPGTPVIGGYPTGNTVVISPTSKIINFKPGQKVRIYGAKISSSNPGNILPPNLTAVNKIGFSAELSGPTTFSYKIAQFDYTTGRVSGCINDVDVLTATNVNVNNFNDVNYIGVTFTRANPSYGILIYRSVGTPVNVPYSLVAVLGPKDLVDTSETWNDYYDYNYVSWSKKSIRNEFTTNSGVVHFPITPSVNARLGWVDAEVSFVDNTLYRVSFINDYNFENSMIVSHDDTSIIQTAIDNRFAAGGKSLELATKTYIVQGLTIPDNFAIIGNATKTTLKKLGWSSSTSPTGNKLLRSLTTVNDFSITNVVLDGNMQNQYLVSEAGDEKANYLIDVRGSVSRYENIKLINAIGGGINASDSNSISVISSFVIDSNLDDFYYYSPLDITASSDVLITSNIFRNFSGGIEASVVTSGSIVGNIIKNCGTGLVIYGSTNLISSPNILMGTAGEFLPTPDILNSEYDSVNIKLEPNNGFESTVYVYQENGSNFNLTANRSELFHRVDKLQKDALTGVESLYGDEVLISGNKPLQTESGNDLANGQFSFSISQVNVDVLLSTYSYSSLRGPTNEGKNPNHIGLVYRSMLKEYVPTGNVNPVFTPFANNISKTISANTLGVNSISNTIKVTNNDAVNTYFNFNTGDMVYYNLASTSSAIGGLTANTVYYVSFANSTDIALTSTYNGANIDLTEIRTAAEIHNLDKTVYVVKLFDGATNISFGKKVRFLDHGGTPDLNGLVGTVLDFNLSSDICAIAYDPTINITSPGTVGRITVENSFVLAKGRIL